MARDRDRHPRASVRDGQSETLVEVLNQVREGHAQTRAQITRRTRLSRAVVTQRVDDIIAHGLLEDTDLGPSTGGRAPRNLRFRAELGFVLGADIGASHITVAATDLGGRVIAHQEEAAEFAAGPEVVLGRVQELFDGLISTMELSPRLWGIGIGLPARVPGDGRTLVAPVTPDWEDYPIRDVLASRYDVPVWVDNDVNVMALGEIHAGTAGEQELVFVVKLGTGIGASIVEYGHLVRGAQGAAGDVGHIQVTDDVGVVCRCGRVGCLEALAGGGAIARRAEEAAREGRSNALAEMLTRKPKLEAKDVASAASRGDQVSLELLSEAGRLVGTMLSSVISVLNPSLILIGGGVVGAGDRLLAIVREAVYGRSHPLATRDLVIQSAALGHLGGVIGAAIMVLDDIFSAQKLPLWLGDGSPAGHRELSSLQGGKPRG